MTTQLIKQDRYSWQGNLAAAGVILGFIVLVNMLLVHSAPQSGMGVMGIWLWILILSPLTNLLLMLVCIASRHSFHRIFAARSSSCVVVAIAGCGMAVLVDAVAILVHAMK